MNLNQCFTRFKHVDSARSRQHLLRSRKHSLVFFYESQTTFNNFRKTHIIFCRILMI